MEEILRFLRENVDGRTLHTDEMEYALEGGALRGVYSDQISFSGLRSWDTGLTLDMFIVSNEKIYEAAGSAQGLALGAALGELRRDESAVSLFRYELARRRSTGALTGHFRFISASGKAVAAEAIVSAIYNVRLEGGALLLREEQALYRDQHAAEGWRPVAFCADQRFHMENGKLRFEYEAESWDVDPRSLARSPSGDAFPAFRSAER